jgi:pyridoxamine 5'-phosphate oxidase-like protein
MKAIKVTRPKFPKGYVDRPSTFVTWDWVAARLTESKNYWLCSVRPPTPESPAGRPHVIPRWGVFLDGKIYYDGSPETRHARNIKLSPDISVHLENGTQPIILYGRSVASAKPSPELGRKLSQAYKKKYKELGYAPGPNSWDAGGLYVFTMHECITWTNFIEDPTKFLFEEE